MASEGWFSQVRFTNCQFTKQPSFVSRFSKELSFAFKERESQRSVASSQPAAAAAAAVNTTLSDEQRERMLKNQRMAEEKRLARLRQKAEAESQALSSQDVTVDEAGAGLEGETLDSQILSRDDDVSMDE